MTKEELPLHAALLASLGLLCSAVLGTLLAYLFEQGLFKSRDALSGLMSLVAPSKASLVENLSLKSL